MDGAAVTQFMGLTNTDEETARRWLAASATSGGAVDVQAALSLYFEAQGGEGGDTSGATSTDEDEEEEPAVYGGGGHGMAPSAASRGGYGGGIATLSSMRDDGDEEEVRAAAGVPVWLICWLGVVQVAQHLVVS